MTNLDRKKIEKEYFQVKGARLELEYKILSLEDEINRLKEHVQVQINKENELEKAFNSQK